MHLALLLLTAAITPSRDWSALEIDVLAAQQRDQEDDDDPDHAGAAADRHAAAAAHAAPRSSTCVGSSFAPFRKSTAP